MKFGRLALSALFASSSLAAHPHARIDQQAQLSIGRAEAVVTYYMVPSAAHGARMFGHVDVDRDGILSRTEMSTFARALLARSRLSVNGRPKGLTLTHFAFPERRAMLAGRGAIKVKARARLGLTRGARHVVAFDVTHARFARSWFVQPFYFADLGRAPPKVLRRPGSNGVRIFI